MTTAKTLKTLTFGNATITAYENIGKFSSVPTYTVEVSYSGKPFDGECYRAAKTTWRKKFREVAEILADHYAAEVASGSAAVGFWLDMTNLILSADPKTGNLIAEDAYDTFEYSSAEEVGASALETIREWAKEGMPEAEAFLKDEESVVKYEVCRDITEQSSGAYEPWGAEDILDAYDRQAGRDEQVVGLFDTEEEARAAFEDGASVEIVNQAETIYKIEASIETPEAYKGNEPWSDTWDAQTEWVSAETEAEAMSKVMEYFGQKARDINPECEVEEDHILVYEDGKLSQVEYFRVCEDEERFYHPDDKIM